MADATNAPAPQSRALAPIDVLRDGLTKMQPQFAAALPAHIPPEKFVRTVMTALQVNPGIVECSRPSIYAACMKAAQDGLVLDGREAALVKFGSEAQYMKMVAGILKQARNSGDISTLNAHVVYERDTFSYTLGDDEKIEHKPHLGEDRGKPVLVYAVARLKDGGVQRAVMTVAEVEKVRAVSRAKGAGPWTQWWDEMAKKTVIRRLAKYLPSSTDRDGFDEVVRRDDDLYDVDAAAPQSPAPAAPAEPEPRKRRTRASQVIEGTAVQTPAPAAAPQTAPQAEDFDDIPESLRRAPAPAGAPTGEDLI
ncbi:MAG: recombinase RecT [Azospirillum sp.]|nr:recombinase RecT [Azospirillum sp.]